MHVENEAAEGRRPAGVPRGVVRATLSVVLFLLLGMVAGYLGWRAAGGGSFGALDHPIVTDEAFALADLDGNQSGPALHLGEVVVVDFWATWCAPCHAQARILEMLFDEVGEQVRFFAVDVGEDEQTVRDFVAERPFPYPVLLDTDGAVAQAAGVYGFPTVLIYGRSGEVIFRRAGISGKRELLEAIIAELSIERASSGSVESGS